MYQRSGTSTASRYHGLREVLVDTQKISQKWRHRAGIIKYVSQCDNGSHGNIDWFINIGKDYSATGTVADPRGGGGEGGDRPPPQTAASPQKNCDAYSVSSAH